jgi:PhnB protein
MKLQTYLNFAGSCEQALHFYEKHLGGKITMLMTFDQMPEPKQFPPEMEKAVLHASITIAGTELMASDGPQVLPMRSAYLSLRADSTEDAERLYAVLGEDGEIFMPMTETFFAHRFGMLRDQFGTNWMILHDKPMGA